jgi:hypothetical protein
MPPQLHLAEDTLPLHFLFERLQRLINIVVTHENLHLAAFSCSARARRRVREYTRHSGIPTRGLAL